MKQPDIMFGFSVTSIFKAEDAPPRLNRYEFLEDKDLERIMEFLLKLEVEGISVEDHFIPNTEFRDKFIITYTLHKQKKRHEVYFGNEGKVRMRDERGDVLLTSINPLIKIFERVDNFNQLEAREALFRKDIKERMLNLRHITIESKVKILAQEMDFEYSLYDATNDLVFNKKTKEFEEKKPAMILSIKLDKKNCLDTEIPIDDFQSVLGKLEELIREIMILYHQKHPFKIIPLETKHEDTEWEKGE